MAKNNIRSVRFSDELIEIIEQQVGDNFTQKFERLVYNCYMLLPEKERQVVALRYYHGMTQQNCAKVMHVSQVQISRLERRAVDALRAMLE